MSKWLPSLDDSRLNSGVYRGEVLRFVLGKKELGAIAYGATVEEMRRRKHAIVKLFNELEGEK